MKEHKILVTGRLKASIDDFFYHTSDDFILLSSSLRYDDVVNHLKVFEPDALVICLGGETSDDLNAYINLRQAIERAGTPVIIVGSSDSCDIFIEALPKFVRECFVKPIAIENIRDGLIKMFREIKLEKEKAEALIAEQERKKEEELKAQEEDVRKHILVIDDDPIMLRVVKEQLKGYYDVAAAVNGRIAYKFLESKKPDMILLDYEMPIENGKVVYEKIRQMEGMEEIPIVFLTGVNDSERIKEVLALKPQGYLLKPIEKDALIAMIRNHIG